MNREHAITVAKELVAPLLLVTSRLIVAGSLRRRKQEVSDVEILFVPRFKDVRGDLFAFAHVDCASEVLTDLLNAGHITKRPNSRGSFTWGQKNKLALYRGTDPVDFFSTTEENWWVSLVIRTGSLAMNLELTTGAQKLGRSLNAYGCGVTCSDNSVIPATSEEHVFELCGVPYREPWERG